MNDDHLGLGQAPRPATGEELVQRIRSLLLADDHDSASLREVLAVLDRTSIELDGVDVASLTIDATGVRMSMEDVEGDLRGAGDREDGGQQAAIVAREPGVLRQATVVAHPLEVAGVPIEVDVDLHEMPFHWIEADDGTVGVEAVEPGADSPLTGTAVLSVPQQQLVDAVRVVAESLAAEQGIGLSDLDVRLSPAGPRGARIDAEARVRKGFLGATVEATAAASIDDDLVLRFDDVSLTSGNVLVAGMLGMVRSRVEQATSRPIRLGDALPEGIRVTDMQIDVGPTITLSARLG